jgi:hypothetical protein
MPDFAIVSLKEATLRTIPGRQGKFINEYAGYIQQLTNGQAGKLRIGDEEKHSTIRRHLLSAAKAMNISLTIKRSGNDLYFWREDGGEEQPRVKRRYTRRSSRGRVGDYFPPQPFIEPELSDQGIQKEEPPELGQLAAEAERRVEQS